jgi:glutathionylspermidine amidase/synthetase
MQNVFREAGIESKLCIMTDKFYWKDSRIVDSDGVTVNVVWKLWMWETVFQDYIEATKERGLDDKNSKTFIDGWKPTDGEHPRLSDILLNDQIKVIEPLWKVITSNKGLLPVLWTMYPNHPLLLHSEWTLTDELKREPFVKKPIVGRCGHNVTLYENSGDSVIDETMGKFSARDSVYQQMFQLANYDGYHPIIGSWIIHDHFAGFCIREDQKLITDANSPVTACCLV